MPSFLSLLLSIVLISASNWLGRQVIKLLKTTCGGGVCGWVLRTSLGFGVLSYVIFIFGIFQLYSSPGKKILLLMIAVFALLEIINLLGNLKKKKEAKKSIKQKFPIINIILVILLISIAIVTLICALAPPSGDDWDSLAYHLSVPKLFIEHGGIYYIDFTSHSNFPMLQEMLYIPSLMLNSPIAAKLIHYWMGVMLILSCGLLIKKHFNSRASLLAMIGIAGVPLIMWEATTAYIDLAPALYTVLAIIFLFNYFDSNKKADLIICALMAGFAASCKMTSLALFPILAIWLLIHRYAQNRKIEIKPTLLLALISIISSIPWYLKTWIYTKNPVYPFFYSIFGGNNWNAELANIYTVNQAKFGMGKSILSLLMLPYNLAVHPEKFNDPGLFLVVGPILLIAILCLLLISIKNKKMTGLAVFFILQILMWFILTQQSRYLISAYAIGAVLSAAIIYNDEKQKLIQCAVLTLYVVTAIFGIYTMLPYLSKRVNVVFGKESQEAYLSRTLNIYNAQQFINSMTFMPNQQMKIALFGDTRGFYLNHPYIWADGSHNVTFTRDFKSAEELVSYMKSLGITYAMVDFRFFPQRESAGGIPIRVYEAIDKRLFEQFYPESMFSNSSAYLFRVM